MLIALRTVHFLGLTMFLGSIAVYIALGTPEHDAALLAYNRMSVQSLVQAITIPGLVLTVMSGIGMVLRRRGYMRMRFGKVKVLVGFTLLVNTYFIYQAIASSAQLTAGTPPFDTEALNALLTTEAILGAVNVLVILATIIYSVKTLRRRTPSNDVGQ
jgi:ascorbate-specific PTS system EIIC-type component UlaA